MLVEMENNVRNSYSRESEGEAKMAVAATLLRRCRCPLIGGTTSVRPVWGCFIPSRQLPFYCYLLLPLCPQHPYHICLSPPPLYAAESRYCLQDNGSVREPVGRKAGKLASATHYSFPFLETCPTSLKLDQCDECILVLLMEFRERSEGRSWALTMGKDKAVSPVCPDFP